MQGKEEINLIDVNADDFTDPSEITKHLTEEQTYQSHRKKDKEITGQQKRKHQITYLAFQVTVWLIYCILFSTCNKWNFCLFV
jgi:proline-rich protein PRCC